MKYFILSFTAIGLLFTMSCNDDSKDTAPNSAPDSFTVSVIDISADQASITWEEVSDPDDDVVTFEVTLEGSVILSDVLNAGTSVINLVGLTVSTDYEGIVTADDGNENGTTEAPFSFTTLSDGSRE